MLVLRVVKEQRRTSTQAHIATNRDDNQEKSASSRELAPDAVDDVERLFALLLAHVALEHVDDPALVLSVVRVLSACDQEVSRHGHATHLGASDLVADAHLLRDA